MYEFSVLATLVLVRIVLPLGLLLLIGEMGRSRQARAYRGK